MVQREVVFPGPTTKSGRSTRDSHRIWHYRAKSASGDKIRIAATQSPQREVPGYPTAWYKMTDGTCRATTHFELLHQCVTNKPNPNPYCHLLQLLCQPARLLLTSWTDSAGPWSLVQEVAIHPHPRGSALVS